MKNAEVNSLKVFYCSKVAVDAVERNGNELIQHPAYSPDLAPSHFFLFPNLENDIRGYHLRSDEEVVTTVGSGSMERTLTFSVLG